ncbi:hypothetical protein D3C83_120070 [compost metagenome]
MYVPVKLAAQFIDELTGKISSLGVAISWFRKTWFHVHQTEADAIQRPDIRLVRANSVVFQCGLFLLVLICSESLNADPR